MVHNITIRWGQDPEYWEIKRYAFDTAAELAAFRLGVDEAYQELDAQEMPNFPATTYLLEDALTAFDLGFTVSVCHPDDPDDVLTSVEQIRDADGLLFAIGVTQ